MDKEKNENPQATDPSQQIKFLLLVVLVASLVAPLASSLIVVSALSSKLAGPGSAPHADQEESAEEPAEPETAAEQPIAFYEPMEFLVNLADTESTHYLKTTVSLGSRVGEEEAAQPGKKKGHGGGHGGGQGAAGPQPAIFSVIKAREPMIRDLIISVISSYPMAVLASVQGKRELKDTLSARLQQELGAKDLNVFFTAFTLQ